jgi:plasmid stabilization system protein ParE
MNFRFLFAARQDVLDTEQRLEGEHPGYGEAFADEILAASLAIIANPRLDPLTTDGPRRPETRESYITRFCQRVIFALTATDIVILAVVHAHRRPRSWVRRLRDLN